MVWTKQLLEDEKDPVTEVGIHRVVRVVKVNRENHFVHKNKNQLSFFHFLLGNH